MSTAQAPAKRGDTRAANDHSRGVKVWVLAGTIVVAVVALLAGLFYVFHSQAHLSGVAGVVASAVIASATVGMLHYVTVARALSDAGSTAATDARQERRDSSPNAFRLGILRIPPVAVGALLWLLIFSALADAFDAVSPPPPRTASCECSRVARDSSAAADPKARFKVDCLCSP